MSRTLLNTTNRGAAAIQYGLIAALVAAGLATVLPTLGGKLSTAICEAASGLPGGTACGQTIQQQYMAAGYAFDASANVCPGTTYADKASCSAAGYMWDGTYCDTAAHALQSAQQFCSGVLATMAPALLGSGTTCSYSNGAFTIGPTRGPQINDSCLSAGGAVREITPNTNYSCVIQASATTVTTLGCVVSKSGNTNPDGTCSAISASSRNTTLNSSCGSPGVISTVVSSTTCPAGSSASLCENLNGTLSTSASYGAICKFP